MRVKFGMAFAMLFPQHCANLVGHGAIGAVKNIGGEFAKRFQRHGPVAQLVFVYFHRQQAGQLIALNQKPAIALEQPKKCRPGIARLFCKVGNAKTFQAFGAGRHAQRGQEKRLISVVGNKAARRFFDFWQPHLNVRVDVGNGRVEVEFRDLRQGRGH